MDADRTTAYAEALFAVARAEGPLAEIEDAVRGKLPGEVLKVEVEREDGAWIYEFKTIDPRGRRSDVYVDAKTGKILETKRK